ncbi:MAG: thioredoxin domain-containing protein [Caldilinea sp.]|jgi:protein-disulfide isomerase|nr:thioredoxin domain-containing protein [Caldilinea sp.]
MKTPLSSRSLPAILLFVLVWLAGCTPIRPTADNTGAVAAPAAETAAETAAAEAERLPLPDETYEGMPVGFTEEGYPFRGDPNAAVTLYEYSDYECPFCARHFVQTEAALNETYVRSGQLRVIFRDFPIESLHPNAPAAHTASLCVADQGAALYWEMHARLFQSQTEWSNALEPLVVLERLASEVGADLALYNRCMETEQADKQGWIEAALAEGQQLGVSGTPSFNFVDRSGANYLLVGAQPFASFASYIDALLAGEVPAGAAEPEAAPAQIPVWATAEGWQPDPDRPGANLAGDWQRGSPDAKVVVVEFSDFQCPFCRQHTLETQPVLDEQFVDSGAVRWVFKHFPLQNHPQAPAAGVAAECAGEQEKFWEMHDLLFETVSAWSIGDPTPIFVDLAAQLDLDPDAFTACFSDPAMAERVSSDLNDGAPFVQGTPSFIVLFNGEGRIVQGALPVETFTQALQEILDQMQ